jgi:hypothetical protein
MPGFQIASKAGRKQAGRKRYPLLTRFHDQQSPIAIHLLVFSEKLPSIEPRRLPAALVLFI